ncbi:DUF262 domain-containing protein [Bernardetia sp. OM2101]|uniref:DUF262 domain-containing protein n=1 Tax=Bernardetia sp. OM2101 TaxID=3344876 RepID=UPI0035CEC2EE
MKATESKIQEFLSSNKTQFVIPVYQRNYDWTTSECKQLLDDILEVGSNRETIAHFIGSIVYVHDDVYTTSRIKELIIIDGQQRLTTLTLIYLALHRLAKDINDEGLENEIHETYLINKFASEDEKLKLKPTDNNEKALKYLIRSTEEEDFPDFSKLVENFNYFKGRITKENVEVVLQGLSKLMFVEISLDRDKDDPQRIFESLNSTGLELSQADLIRNYILMGLDRKDQNKIYRDYWQVIEDFAKDEKTNISKVSDFIRDFLTLENKKIPNKGKVYLEFKIKYPTSSLDNLEDNLRQLKSLVRYYNKLVNPKNEKDKDIRNQLEYIDKLEINVSYPFLMKVYEDYSNGIIDKNTFLSVLELVQSFTWRRFIVGLPTNALNKIFMILYDKIEDDYLYSIQKYLMQRPGVQRFPKDTEVIDALKVKDMYNVQSKNRTYFLERLENHENREPVLIDNNPEITIEHIFPKNPDMKWRKELSEDEYKFMMENYLHTISNLTLSGNNGKLGNKTFEAKRDLPEAGYKDSRLWLNRYLANAEKWNRQEIEKRFEVIAERFLQIWEYPSIEIEENDEQEEANIFDADTPKHKKLEYAVFFDEKIKVKQVAKLYVEVIKRLFDLQPETFFTTDLGEKLSLTKKENKSNLHLSATLNDSYYIETRLDNVTKFERIKYALTAYDLEDALSIKYATEE